MITSATKLTRRTNGASSVAGVLAALSLAALVGCASTEPTAANTGGFEPDQPAAATRDPGMRDRPTAATSTDSRLRTIYFDFDQASLRQDARESLRHNARVLAANPRMSVTIEGHCDERGSNEYNLALGDRRANAAMSYLVDLGVESSRIRTVSFGEEKPAVLGQSEAAWAKNRRGEFTTR